MLLGMLADAAALISLAMIHVHVLGTTRYLDHRY
jgi:hypothetical protein